MSIIIIIGIALYGNEIDIDADFEFHVVKNKTTFFVMLLCLKKPVESRKTSADMLHS